MQTWDFAGQNEYYDMAHVFLTALGIYAFVLDLSVWVQSTVGCFEAPSEHIEAIHFWLTALLLHAPDARFL